MSAEEVAALRLMLREVGATNGTGIDYALVCQRERDEARSAYASAAREWAERCERDRERIVGLTLERDRAVHENNRLKSQATKRENARLTSLLAHAEAEAIHWRGEMTAALAEAEEAARAYNAVAADLRKTTAQLAAAQRAQRERDELRGLLDAMRDAHKPASADELDLARMDAAVARAERDAARAALQQIASAYYWADSPAGTTAREALALTPKLLERERDEARDQRDAAQRELHRLIHGAEIEGDGACEHELRANEAHASWLHWQRQYAEAARERDELREARDEARANLAAAQRELHRLSCGETIEGDGLCPEGIRADAARAWSRLWHREARRLWREVQDLNALLSEEHREVMRLRSVIRRYLRTNPPQVEELRDLLFRSADGEDLAADREVASTRAAALREAADIARAHGGISAYYAIVKLAAKVEP